MFIDPVCLTQVPIFCIITVNILFISIFWWYESLNRKRTTSVFENSKIAVYTFCGFISHPTVRATNISNIFSGVHSLTGKTIVIKCYVNMFSQFALHLQISKLITSSSCLMCGRKSFWNDSKAPFNLSSKVCLFKLVLLFEAHLSPFFVRDKISRTWLSLWTSRTIAWICSLIRRCWRTVIMQVFSISSWCLSSWKVELIHPKSLISDTSSLKFVVDSWKKYK